MLNYLYYKEVFQEVPDEITLGISISGCQLQCKGCHSKELWEDKGTPLTLEEFDRLLKKHKGCSCVLLLGGEHDIDALTELFKYAHQYTKTAWYCGLDIIPLEKQKIVKYLDYLKLGHYDMALGGLDSPTTNQRLYSIEHCGERGYLQNDITHRLQKHEDEI